MTDQELLTMAAKAAGYVALTNGQAYSPEVGNFDWNPLTDDGDALRLAVKLGIELVFTKNKIGAGRRSLLTYPWVNEDRNVDDPYAATRRAIVRAAAAIGKQTETKP